MRAAHVFKAEDIAHYYGVEEATVNRLIDDGQICVIAPHADRMVHEADLDAFLATAQQTGNGGFIPPKRSLLARLRHREKSPRFS